MTVKYHRRAGGLSISYGPVCNRIHLHIPSAELFYSPMTNLILHTNTNPKSLIINNRQNPTAQTCHGLILKFTDTFDANLGFQDKAFPFCDTWLSLELIFCKCCHP